MLSEQTYAMSSDNAHIEHNSIIMSDWLKYIFVKNIHCSQKCPNAIGTISDAYGNDIQISASLYECLALARVLWVPINWLHIV